MINSVLKSFFMLHTVCIFIYTQYIWKKTELCVAHVFVN